MDAERWRQARELFDRLADLPPDSWEARLAEESADGEVRAEALALLRADAQVTEQTAVAAHAPDLLDAAAEQQERAQSARLVGRRLGPFALVREIGRGGMGQVWLAQRVDGQFEQQVAIKLLRYGWDNADALSRFRAERQILASLTHPNIAHLVDGGVDEEGRPWLALEYVDGSDLRAHCDARRLDLVQRLRLFLTVCEAVSYAHARLVVHRDIKPSNVLVTEASKVKLLDFGIAKLIQSDAATSATRVFTPEYAAPEQVRGEAVTTSVDVYALGLLLYELLTGRRPYKLENSTPAAYERAILDQEPTRPSLVVTRRDEQVDADALAAQRDLSPARLRRELRGDLDAIVLKALRKEPAQRYASVGEFADDVKAWLAHRPVQARRGGWRYLAGRFLRRHALAAALATVAVLGLVGGLALALWQAQVARTQRDTARQALGFMNELFLNADPGMRKKSELEVRDLLDEGARSIHYALQNDDDARTDLLLVMTSAYIGLDLADPAEPLLDEAEALAQRRGLGMQQAEALRLRCLTAFVRTHAEPCEALLDRAQALLDLRDPRQVDLLAQIADVRSLYLSKDNRHADIVRHAQHALGLLGTGPATRRRREELIGTLSYSLIKLDRAAEAETVTRAMVEELRGTHDVPPRVLADALDNLARAVGARGRRDEALPLYGESLALMEKLYGKDNPIISVKLSNYAVGLYEAGKLKQAQPLIQRVVALDRAGGVPRERALVNSLNNLGALEFQLGNDDAARAALDEDIALAERIEQPMFVGRASRWRGVLAMSQGRYEEARADFARSASVLAKLYEANHVTLLRGRLLELLLNFAQHGRGVGSAGCADAKAVDAAFAASTKDAKSVEAKMAGMLRGLCEDPATLAPAMSGLGLADDDYRWRYVRRVETAWQSNAVK